MQNHTARDVKKTLLRLAARSGKVTSKKLTFTAGMRTITEKAAKGKPATGKALRHLEAEGRLLIHEPENKRKARSYTLLTGRAHRYHKKKNNAKKRRINKKRIIRGNGLRAPDVPRLH
jgi:hypothetical protein